MKLRLNADASEVKEFLDRVQYPFEWELTCLARYCLLTTIEAASGDVAGHVWFNWVANADRVVDMHVCVAPEYRGRTLTRRVGLALLELVAQCGARTILCRPESPEHLAYLLRLGFESHGPFAIFPLEGTPWANPSRTSSVASAKP